MMVKALPIIAIVMFALAVFSDMINNSMMTLLCILGFNASIFFWWRLTDGNN